jgi:hypothetical protein
VELKINNPDNVETFEEEDPDNRAMVNAVNISLVFRLDLQGSVHAMFFQYQQGWIPEFHFMLGFDL